MKLLIALAFLVGCSSVSPMVDVHGAPNLVRVDDGVWRSGQITTAAGWSYWRSVAGGKRLHVLKLNYANEGSDALATAAGIDVHEIPMQPEGDQDLWDDFLSVWKGPDLDDVAKAEALLASASADDVWLVHCTHGQDRTGFIIGEHRVLHDHWTKDHAYAEMRANHFHPELRGVAEAWARFAP